MAASIRIVLAELAEGLGTALKDYGEGALSLSFAPSDPTTRLVAADHPIDMLRVAV